MTESIRDVPLTRPAPAAEPGPLDDHLYDLVEDHFRWLIERNPLVGTYFGIHTEDRRLGDGTRDGVLGDIDASASLWAGSKPCATRTSRRTQGSSGTSRSTRRAGRSSISTRSGRGNGARRRSTSSATLSS